MDTGNLRQASQRNVYLSARVIEPATATTPELKSRPGNRVLPGYLPLCPS